MPALLEIFFYYFIALPRNPFFYIKEYSITLLYLNSQRSSFYGQYYRPMAIPNNNK
jgi:hypothetical protein